LEILQTNCTDNELHRSTKAILWPMLLWRAYRNSPTLFRTVPSPPPMASSCPRLGVCNPNPKLQSLLSQKRLKPRTANLADTFTGSIRTQAHEKIWKKAWAYPGTSQIFGVPLLSQAWVKIRTSNLAGRYIHRVHLNKNPLKFLRKENVGVPVSRDCPNFLSTPYYLRNG